MIVGSGVDVIEIARVERALEHRGERFERRVFTPQEIETCRRARRPEQQFALRFAAKEAAMKAVGTGWGQGVRWLDIETAPRAGARGGPEAGLRLTLRGRAAELAAERGGERTHLALSRSRTHAVAVVLLEGADD
ncbi:MAG: holo-ACP synthase [Proteobacteria bacterium]|nr:holo-ACP synthase [Pseudomonadota bacterium]